jgi:hypothetical protein
MHADRQRAWAKARDRPSSDTIDVSAFAHPTLADVSHSLRAIAAKILELFRPLDQPPLADLSFFVGCRRVTQEIDFVTCHFRRLRSLLGTHSCPLGDPKPQLDQPADGFGARWMVFLRGRPAIDARKPPGLETQADQRALARGRRPPLLFP